MTTKCEPHRPPDIRGRAHPARRSQHSCSPKPCRSGSARKHENGSPGQRGSKHHRCVDDGADGAGRYGRLVAEMAIPHRRRDAYWQLLAFGPVVVPVLHDGLSHGDAAVREGCVQLLLPAVIRLLTTDPDKHVRAMPAELVGRAAHTAPEAVRALEAVRDGDPEPGVRKKAGWYAPGGTIYERLAR